MARPLSQPAFSKRQKQQTRAFRRRDVYAAISCSTANQLKEAASRSTGRHAICRRNHAERRGWLLALTGTAGSNGAFIYRAMPANAPSKRRRMPGAGRHPSGTEFGRSNPIDGYFIARPPNRRLVQLVVLGRNGSSAVQAVSVALAGCANR